MRELEWLRALAATLQPRPLFVTVSGAHLYGFPSPDSDVDLRGAHLLPLADVIGLDQPNQSIERSFMQDGTEIDLVSHDLGKYLHLLVKNNGYVLEQIFSPLVVCGQEFLDELRPLAQRCITRHHYHHYRGFLASRKRLLVRQEAKSLKALLYAYRVVLTGIHLLRSGVVEADLPRLATEYDFPFLLELIAQKREEKAVAVQLDWEAHEAQLEALEQRLDEEFQRSRLPEERDRQGVQRFLVEWRLRGINVPAPAA